MHRLVPTELCALALGAMLLAGCGDSPAAPAPPSSKTPPTGQAPVASVVVSAPASTMTVGQTSRFTATLRDAGGNALTGRQIAWSSSNEAAARVAQDGTVTAVAQGTATIRATSEGRSGTAPIQVNRAGGTGGTACCRVCTTGKACGNTCIARNKTCKAGSGCACNAGASSLLSLLEPGNDLVTVPCDVLSDPSSFALLRRT